MAQIAIWLKRLVGLVVLAGFLELVLPDNQLKSVTKLILGLTILLFLLQPVSNLTQLPEVLTGALTKAFSVRAPDTPATGQVMRKGLWLRQRWQQEFHRELQQELQTKLQKVFAINANVILQQVTCRYEGGRLAGVKLTVTLGVPRPLSVVQMRRLQQQTIRAVQAVTTLPPGQIEIVWGE
jgi:hypothetical protein